MERLPLSRVFEYLHAIYVSNGVPCYYLNRSVDESAWDIFRALKEQSADLEDTAPLF
jgi:hypothetical protein